MQSLLIEGGDVFPGWAERHLPRSAFLGAGGGCLGSDQVLERKLYDIDRADIQAVTDGSDDGFLYARCFIVAMGRDFCDAVAADPQAAVPDAECKEMCYFFAHLYRERSRGFPETGAGIPVNHVRTRPAGPADPAP